MSHRPIIDAGPSLNFLSINKERLLIGVLGPISAPETVQAEVLRKSREDERFHASATVWRKLTPRWIRTTLEWPPIPQRCGPSRPRHQARWPEMVDVRDDIVPLP
jgi:hypothetical protein